LPFNAHSKQTSNATDLTAMRQLRPVNFNAHSKEQAMQHQSVDDLALKCGVSTLIPKNKQCNLLAVALKRVVVSTLIQNKQAMQRACIRSFSWIFKFQRSFKTNKQCNPTKSTHFFNNLT
jgi:hypothetical protein